MLSVIRHGQPCRYEIKDGKLSNPGLSEEGKRLVQSLPKFEKVFCSPARRAMETARMIADNIEVIDDLNAVDFTGNEFPSNPWQECWVRGDESFEPIDDFVNRIRYSLPSEGIIVAHEEVIWAIMAIKTRIPMDKAIKVHIPYASVWNF